MTAAVQSAFAAEPKLSEATQACLDCHREATPGIVADWKKSRMAKRTVAQALKEPDLKKRVSAQSVPPGMMNVVVGCAECHTQNPKTHKDTFKHDGHMVHTVVSPKDCATCHPSEEKEYGQNLMSHARGNLLNNAIYQDMIKNINSTPVYAKGALKMEAPGNETMAETCLACHGTKVEVKGMRKVMSDLGEFELPRLSGWPNHGVGRVNPDGSKGSCAACHSRHSFAIEMARRPATCAECHKGPDVPAYKVYQVSKHGNLYANLGKSWNFKAVPWTVGEDFNAPTCASCHVSLLVDTEGAVVSKRSHRMNDRLGDRLMGLIYAHRHPKSPDTSIIKNADGQPLATTFSGKPAKEFLIGQKEYQKRRRAMERVCLACHSSGWVKGQFARLDNAIKTSNQSTLAATGLMQDIWKQGLAKGPDQGGSVFDEYKERVWVEHWLFYANTMRLATAMMGQDYAVFEMGRWQASKNIRRLHDWTKSQKTGK